MNVASILTKAYHLTNTSATTLLDGNATNVLAELNTQYGHRTLRILGVQSDINSFLNEQYTDLKSSSGLVAGDNGFNGEYAFDTDTLRPVLIEVSFDGSEWYPADVYDIGEAKGSEQNQTQIQTEFSEYSPKVRFERDSYIIRPLKTSTGDITKGIHLWYEQRQTDMTTGSPDFEQNLHDVLAFDLADQEIIMHSGKYDYKFLKIYGEEKQKVNDLFDEFYHDRFKRNYQFQVDEESFE